MINFTGRESLDDVIEKLRQTYGEHVVNYNPRQNELRVGAFTINIGRLQTGASTIVANNLLVESVISPQGTMESAAARLGKAAVNVLSASANSPKVAESAFRASFGGVRQHDDPIVFSPQGPGAMWLPPREALTEEWRARYAHSVVSPATLGKFPSPYALQHLPALAARWTMGQVQENVRSYEPFSSAGQPYDPASGQVISDIDPNKFEKRLKLSLRERLIPGVDVQSPIRMAGQDRPRSGQVVNTVMPLVSTPFTQGGGGLVEKSLEATRAGYPHKVFIPAGQEYSLSVQKGQVLPYGGQEPIPLLSAAKPEYSQAYRPKWGGKISIRDIQTSKVEGGTEIAFDIGEVGTPNEMKDLNKSFLRPADLSGYFTDVGSGKPIQAALATDLSKSAYQQAFSFLSANVSQPELVGRLVNAGLPYDQAIKREWNANTAPAFIKAYQTLAQERGMVKQVSSIEALDPLQQKEFGQQIVGGALTGNELPEKYRGVNLPEGSQFFRLQYPAIVAPSMVNWQATFRGQARVNLEEMVTIGERDPDLAARLLQEGKTDVGYRDLLNFQSFSQGKTNKLYTEPVEASKIDFGSVSAQMEAQGYDLTGLQSNRSTQMAMLKFLQERYGNAPIKFQAGDETGYLPGVGSVLSHANPDELGRPQSALFSRYFASLQDIRRLQSVQGGFAGLESKQQGEVRGRYNLLNQTLEEMTSGSDFQKTSRSVAPENAVEAPYTSASGLAVNQLYLGRNMLATMFGKNISHLPFEEQQVALDRLQQTLQSNILSREQLLGMKREQLEQMGGLYGLNFSGKKQTVMPTADIAGGVASQSGVYHADRGDAVAAARNLGLPASVESPSYTSEEMANQLYERIQGNQAYTMAWRRPVTDPTSQIGNLMQLVGGQQLGEGLGVGGADIAAHPMYVGIQSGDVDADRMIALLRNQARYDSESGTWRFSQLTGQEQGLIRSPNEMVDQAYEALNRRGFIDPSIKDKAEAIARAQGQGAEYANLRGDVRRFGEIDLQGADAQALFNQWFEGKAYDEKGNLKSLSAEQLKNAQIQQATTKNQMAQTYNIFGRALEVATGGADPNTRALMDSIRGVTYQNPLDNVLSDKGITGLMEMFQTYVPGKGFGKGGHFAVYSPPVQGEQGPQSEWKALDVSNMGIRILRHIAESGTLTPEQKAGLLSRDPAIQEKIKPLLGQGAVENLVQLESLIKGQGDDLMLSNSPAMEVFAGVPLAKARRQGKGHFESYEKYSGLMDVGDEILNKLKVLSKQPRSAGEFQDAIQEALKGDPSRFNETLETMMEPLLRGQAAEPATFGAHKYPTQRELESAGLSDIVPPEEEELIPTGAPPQKPPPPPPPVAEAMPDPEPSGRRFYKGGQKMPGGARAPKGGAWYGDEVPAGTPAPVQQTVSPVGSKTKGPWTVKTAGKMGFNIVSGDRVDEYYLYNTVTGERGNVGNDKGVMDSFAEEWNAKGYHSTEDYERDVVHKTKAVQSGEIGPKDIPDSELEIGGEITSPEGRATQTAPRHSVRPATRGAESRSDRLRLARELGIQMTEGTEDIGPKHLDVLRETMGWVGEWRETSEDFEGQAPDEARVKAAKALDKRLRSARSIMQRASQGFFVEGAVGEKTTMAFNEKGGIASQFRGALQGGAQSYWEGMTQLQDELSKTIRAGESQKFSAGVRSQGGMDRFQPGLSDDFQKYLEKAGKKLDEFSGQVEKTTKKIEDNGGRMDDATRKDLERQQGLKDKYERIHGALSKMSGEAPETSDDRRAFRAKFANIRADMATVEDSEKEPGFVGKVGEGLRNAGRRFTGERTLFSMWDMMYAGRLSKTFVDPAIESAEKYGQFKQGVDLSIAANRPGGMENMPISPYTRGQARMSDFQMNLGRQAYGMVSPLQGLVDPNAANSPIGAGMLVGGPAVAATMLGMYLGGPVGGLALGGTAGAVAGTAAGLGYMSSVQADEGAMALAQQGAYNKGVGGLWNNFSGIMGKGIRRTFDPTSAVGFNIGEQRRISSPTPGALIGQALGVQPLDEGRLAQIQSIVNEGGSQSYLNQFAPDIAATALAQVYSSPESEYVKQADFLDAEQRRQLDISLRGVAPETWKRGDSGLIGKYSREFLAGIDRGGTVQGISALAGIAPTAGWQDRQGYNAFFDTLQTDQQRMNVLPALQPFSERMGVLGRAGLDQGMGAIISPEGYSGRQARAGQFGQMYRQAEALGADSAVLETLKRIEDSSSTTAESTTRLYEDMSKIGGMKAGLSAIGMSTSNVMLGALDQSQFGSEQARAAYMRKWQTAATAGQFAIDYDLSSAQGSALASAAAGLRPEMAGQIMQAGQYQLGSGGLGDIETTLQNARGMSGRNVNWLASNMRANNVMLGMFGGGDQGAYQAQAFSAGMNVDWGMAGVGQSFMTPIAQWGQLAGMGAGLGAQRQKMAMNYAFQTGSGLGNYVSQDLVDQSIGQGPLPTRGPGGLISVSTGATGGMWGLQDQKRALQREQQLWGYAQQEAGLNDQSAMRGLQYSQFMENWGAQQTQRQFFNQISDRQMGMRREDLTRSFQWQEQDRTRSRANYQQDFSFQRNVDQMQFGWQMEDIDENIRFATGRQRKVLLRQRERTTTMQNVQTERADELDKRQKDEWKIEDERFEISKKRQIELLELEEKSYAGRKQFAEEDAERQKRQYEERFALEGNQLDRQRASFEKQKEWAEQEFELQNRQIELERAHYQEQYDLELKTMGAGLGLQKALTELQQNFTDLQDAVRLLFSPDSQPTRQQGEEKEDFKERYAKWQAQVNETIGKLADDIEENLGKLGGLGLPEDFGKGMLEYALNAEKFAQNITGYAPAMEGVNESLVTAQEGITTTAKYVESWTSTEGGAEGVPNLYQGFTTLFAAIEESLLTADDSLLAMWVGADGLIPKVSGATFGEPGSDTFQGHWLDMIDQFNTNVTAMDEITKTWSKSTNTLADAADSALNKIRTLYDYVVGGGGGGGGGGTKMTAGGYQGWADPGDSITLGGERRTLSEFGREWVEITPASMPGKGSQTPDLASALDGVRISLIVGGREMDAYLRVQQRESLSRDRLRVGA